MKLYKIAAAAMLLCVTSAAPSPWDARPWLEDLDQVRAAFHINYANREWLAEERQFDIDAALDRLAARLGTAGSDDAARALFDRFADRLGDGHVAFRWPSPLSPPQPATAPLAPTPASFCARLGYDARQASRGIGPSLPGYAPEATGQLLPSGIVSVQGVRIGILRIGVFQPQGYPELCEGAVARLRIPLDKSCDEACENAIITDAYARLTSAYEERLRRLRAMGAEAIMIDLTGNGGGSEWAEAAARSLTPRTIVSAPLGFVRGEHWAKHWRELAADLREAARTASRSDRANLLRWAGEADAARAQAETPCEPATGCSWLGRAGYATGLVGSTAPGTFLGKDWGARVFSAGQHDYHPGSWDGAVIVLVDQETWSAAEEFAALLQDNRVATILGARTGGAGCGHTDGGVPTRLTHSGGVLELPDCARFRADGSNEVNGVVPDLVVGWRANDGAAFKARLLMAALPQAIVAARRLAPAAPTLEAVRK